MTTPKKGNTNATAKTTAKKAPAKKADGKKAPPRKPAAKKTTAKKPGVTKAVTKKAPAKKAAPVQAGDVIRMGFHFMVVDSVEARSLRATRVPYVEQGIKGDHSQAITFAALKEPCNDVFRKVT